MIEHSPARPRACRTGWSRPRVVTCALATALLAVSAVTAQFRVKTVGVSESLRYADLKVDASFEPGRLKSWQDAVAGERLLRTDAGELLIVRRVAIVLPSMSATVVASVGRWESAVLAPGDPGAVISSEPSEQFTARIVDRHPSVAGYSATLELVVARVLPDRTTLLAARDMAVRIEHTGWSDAGRRTMVRPETIHTLERPPSGAAHAAEQRSLFAEGDWYRTEIQETGIYKLTRAWFRSAGVTSGELDNIARLRLYGNGGGVVPELLTSPRPAGLTEIARHVVDRDNDGVLDDDDYVLFYGRSVRDWSYDPATKRYAHTVNPYTERNVYFFRFDPAGSGRSMDSIVSAATAGAAVQTVLGRVAVEEERVNFVNSGRRWVGTSFDISASTAVYMNTLHGIDPAAPLSYRMTFFSRSGTIDTFRVTENDQPLGGPVLMFTSDVSSTDQIFNYAYEAFGVQFSHPGGLPGGRSVLKFTFGTRNAAAKGWLDWFEVFYRRRLEAHADRLLFPSPDTSAVLSYTVTNLSSRETFVFDVTDHQNVRRVSGIEFNPADPSVCTFRLSHAAGSPRELAVVGPAGPLQPPPARTVTPSNLRGNTSPAQAIIITPPEFRAQADRLKQHRESRDGLPVLVADLEAVFNEFGGGLPDPMAIRDFLAFARTNYAGPVRYVLLFGNGHFDYRNIGTTLRNWVPPYETAESNFQINSYNSDDYFVLLDPGNPRVSLALGRLPARTLGEVTAMVSKIIRYETGSPVDPWRNRITFVADDGQTSTNPFEGSLHTAQAENLARFHTPPTFEQRKVYIVEYPTVQSASGRRKPDANTDIVEAFNRGSLVLNFTGHGNPRLWTHEAIFTREGDIPRLRNRDRLTLLVAATCNYAQWDNPAEQSSGEILLAREDAGAIGVVTATRSVYSFDNAELNYVLYDNLFARDSAGLPPRLGDAFRLMKQVRYAPNDQKYHLLGDPTMRLLQPRGRVTIDSINGVSTAQVASVPTLGVARVTGAVRVNDSTVNTGFTGTGLIELFDSKRQVSVPEWGGYTYEKTGSVLYRGEISVTAGRFSASVPVPKDVTFGSRARVALYALGSSSDAVGTTEQIAIAGTDTTAAPDTTGPSMSVRLESLDFRPGDIVPQEPMLIVDLSDASGINTSTVGIGHRLEAVLSSDGRIIDLSGVYRGNLDTYQSGRAQVRLTGLPEGKQSVRVRAWDTRNNSSTEEVVFEVRSGSGLDLYQVMNYPNPFNRSTTFTMRRSSDAPVDIRIRIYTVAGRLIQEIEAWNIADRFVRVAWDGRDRDGNEVGNGIYLYKVIAREPVTAASREVIGKLAVVR